MVNNSSQPVYADSPALGRYSLGVTMMRDSLRLYTGQTVKSEASRLALGRVDVVAEAWNDLVVNAYVVSKDDREEIFRSLTDDEKSRSRYLRTYRSVLEVDFGPRWGAGLGLYLDLVPSDVRRALLDLLDKGIFYGYEVSGSLKVLNDDALFKVLKGIGDFSKKFGSVVSSDWQFFVNLETLGGYKPDVDINDFVSDIRDWVSGNIVHKSWDLERGWSEEVFLEDLKAGMLELMLEQPGRATANLEAPSLDEFASDPSYWGGSGSSQLRPVVHVEEGGKHQKLRNTKWKSAAGMSPADIKLLLLDDSPQRNKAIQKRERGKVRAVINSDDSTYLQMAFISSWLERALAGNSKSTLFMSNEDKVEMYTQLSNTIGRDVRVPLDQSHFDWQQSMTMIQLGLDVIEEVVSSAPHVLEYRMVLGQLRRKLSAGKISVGNDVVEIEKGVMSGWRWTALLDTMFNYGEMYAARRLSERLGKSVDLLHLNVQGDDDQVSVRSKSDALALVACYNMMNFEINNSKFFVDNSRDEYLRQVVTKGVVSGYPARGIGAILWRNPVSRDPPAGLLRAREQLSVWNIMLGRGCDRARVFRHMSIDICNANGLSKSDLVELLNTPASLGGLGAGVGGRLALSEGVEQLRGHVLDAPGISIGIGYPDGWSRTDELASWRSKLSTVNNLSDVLPPELKTVEYEPRYFHGYRGVDNAKFPLSARHALQIISPLYADEYLSKAIDNRDWDYIRGYWLDPNIRDTSDYIEQRCGRRVWVDWLKGELPFSAPVLYAHSAESVSAVHGNVAKWVWGLLLSGSRRLNYAVIRAGAVGAEEVTRRYMSKFDVRLGG